MIIVEAEKGKKARGKKKESCGLIGGDGRNVKMIEEESHSKGGHDHKKEGNGGGEGGGKRGGEGDRGGGAGEGGGEGGGDEGGGGGGGGGGEHEHGDEHEH